MADQEHKERQRALEEKKRKLAEMKAAKLKQKEDHGLGIRIDNGLFFVLIRIMVIISGKICFMVG